MSRRWVSPLLILLALGFSLAVVGRLPEQVPTHWGIDGQVDGWSGRWWAALFAPALALGIWLLLVFLPRIDPRRAQYERFRDTYWLIVNGVTAYLAILHVLVLGYALGWPVDVPRAILVLIGLLFVLLGNVMPRLRSNWWMGIRTPWTLSSETVWRETHRLGGRTMTAGGLVAVLAALLLAESGLWVALTAMLAGALVPVVYSYFVWRNSHPSRS